MKIIRDLILRWARNRRPDFIIGGADRPYLIRHWLLPRNRFFNVYVHQFLRSDDDRALHDHPWLFNASWLIEGEYVEQTIAAGGITLRTPRKAGDWKFRWGPAPHRVELLPQPEWDGTCRPRQICFAPGGVWPCWTVFITGPVVRQWGFHCPDQGWIHWKRFTDTNDKGSIGKGCDA
jgi:hypothetical protein